MLPDDTRAKIKIITEGMVIEGQDDSCTTIRNLLCASFPTSTTVKKDFEGKAIVKEKQRQLLEDYSHQHHFWITDLPNEDRYLTRGGEAKVYLAVDNKHVLKLNDGVYYATWLEFFNSILLHNLFFENTRYDLLGFTKQDGLFYAALQQPFVQMTAQAELEDIRKFLEFFGFTNTKRQDYLHKELGLILEDMHDENVIVNSEMLFFIDTVFYTIRPT